MESIKEILSRNIEEESLKNILNIYSDAIDEFVNMGTNIIAWALHKKDGKDHDLILSLILRRFVELADSISILVRSSSIEPAKIILRSLFEMSFYIEYILKNDTERKITIFSLNEDWEEKAALRSILDRFKSELGEEDKKKIKERINKIGCILDSQEYKEIMDEYKKVKKKIKRSPKWYSLFNGPKNIAEIAKYINRENIYIIFYKFFSKTTHGTDVIKGKFNLNDKNIPSIYQIRIPEDAKFIASWTLRLLSLIYIKFTEKVIPQKREKLTLWYEKEGKSYKDSVEQSNITVKK